MCGIAGFVAGPACPQAPEERRALLAAMTGALAHRGPDGQGAWLEGPVALGHRRLSVIDLEAGGQPMQDSGGRAVIVFNGEIYNYRELRRELEALGHAFGSNSDTEVLLLAYLSWGVACLDRLEGMFAFALWDRRERTLFAARDRYGKKPFFYTRQGDVFAFASELSALRRLPFLSFSTTRQALARFLTFEYCPAPESICSEVCKLKPAHYLVLRQGDMRIAPYWRLPAPEPVARISEDAQAERLLGLLDAAVARRLVSDVPLGVFLSGGLDSSLVTALMAQHSSRVRTFSIGFRESSFDESRYSRLVANHLGTVHTERILSADQCGALLPGIVEGFDEPMSDPSIVPTYLLSAVAREQVTVALGGDGGDELFGGYESFYAFRLSQWLDRAPWLLRSGLLKAICRRLPQGSGYVNPRLAALAFLEGAAAPPWQRLQRWLSPFSPDLAAEVLRSGPGLDLRPESLLSPSREAYEACPSGDPLARFFAQCARTYLPNYILVKADRCAMRHGLEVRAPFLDRDLAEFVWRLPLDRKLRGLAGKHLLRRAARGLLPPEILRRPKRGFLIPVAQWLRGVLRPVMEDLLSEQTLRVQGLFSPEAVGRMVRDHLDGTADHRRPLWTLLVLQLWLRKNALGVV